MVVVGGMGSRSWVSSWKRQSGQLVSELVHDDCEIVTLNGPYLLMLRAGEYFFSFYLGGLSLGYEPKPTIVCAHSRDGVYHCVGNTLLVFPCQSTTRELDPIKQTKDATGFAIYDIRSGDLIRVVELSCSITHSTMQSGFFAEDVVLVRQTGPGTHGVYCIDLHTGEVRSMRMDVPKGLMGYAKSRKAHQGREDAVLATD